MTPTNSWQQRWFWIREYLKDPNQIGSITPSSHWLVEAMLRAAPIENASVVVEFGPGTGVFTQAILERMRPDARLLVFETQPRFLEALRSRFSDSRMELLSESAAMLPQVLEERGIASVDRVISGLPFGAFSANLNQQIWGATRAAMGPASVFVSFQYTPFLYAKFRAVFPVVKVSQIVLRNIPPAAIFRCTLEPTAGSRRR